MSEPVAIIGLACRFPDAPHAGAFWQNNVQGLRSFRDHPGLRWDHSRFYDPNPRARNRTQTQKIAALDKVAWFAARTYGVSPRRATVMDPQQRLMIELAGEALQDAGLEVRPYDRRRTATFVGASVCEYASLLTAHLRLRQLGAGQFGDSLPDGVGEQVVKAVPDMRSYTVPGSLISMSASCVAQTFKLGGPAFTIDAACASSLASVVQGVHYLRNQPCRPGSPSPVVLAGGVYLLLLPDNYVGFSKIGALSTEDCRPFDREASGFLLGEGAGLVVLKTLADAERDGDRIYAVLRGVAWNNDGQSESPMRPRQAGQFEALQDALLDAAVEPNTIDYVECHGTATPVGDRVELSALAQALGPRAEKTWLGSVKANLGHTLSAAGIAGLLRAVLATFHRQIPPQTGWSDWHPDLADARSRFEVPLESVPWNSSVRRATVNSFGFGGTNCVAVLESGSKHPGPEPLTSRVPVVCSADTQPLLADYLSLLSASLDGGTDFPAWAYTLANRRRRSEVAFFSAQDTEEAQAQIARLLAGDTSGEIAPPALAPPDGLFPEACQRLVWLPPVPLERQRYWLSRNGPR